MDAESTITPGRLWDETLTKEPHPRVAPKTWSAFALPFRHREFLPYPTAPSPRDFRDVLESRRSAVHGPLSKEELASLLWYATGIRGWEQSGRAGLPISWRPAPSAGGLHPIEIVAIPACVDEEILHYDPLDHCYGYWGGPWCDLITEHIAMTTLAVGAVSGWTLFMIADFARTDAAYENPVTLIMRDAGCLVGTLCLCAEWLGLSSCPIGSLRQDLVAKLGYPEDRFMAVGAVQISKR